MVLVIHRVLREFWGRGHWREGILTEYGLRNELECSSLLAVLFFAEPEADGAVGVQGTALGGIVGW